MNLEQKIEAVLFYKNEPLEIRKLASLLGEKEKEVRGALQNLANSLSGRGICLISTEEEVSLATAPEAKDIVEKVAKDDTNNRDISKAGLEVLAIVLYNGPVSRRGIDYIRGVNSTFTLRSLCMRGLIEKEPDPKDQRIFRYKSSISLLAHLGVGRVEELPEFGMFKKEFDSVREREGGECGDLPDI